MTDHKILEKTAEEWMKRHKGGHFTRRLCDNYWYVGLVGQDEFAIEFHLELDLSYRRYGDGGIDFPTTIGTVDVKTYQKAIHLLVEVGESHTKADIFVLAEYVAKTDSGRLIGWAWREEVLAAPTKVFIKDEDGNEIWNYYIHRTKLHKIEELHELGLKPAERPERPPKVVYNYDPADLGAYL